MPGLLSGLQRRCWYDLGVAPLPLRLLVLLLLLPLHLALWPLYTVL